MISLRRFDNTRGADLPRGADLRSAKRPDRIGTVSPSSARLGSGRGKATKFGWLALKLTLTFACPFVFACLALRLVPLPASLLAPPPCQQQFTDRNGVPLRNVPSAKGVFEEQVNYQQIPQALVNATLAAEDKRFWNHPGVDWRASMRACWSLLRHRRVVSGGSTITQQLIKIAQPRPRTFRTKIIEALQALRLEQLWDKQRILSEYLNRLDYGNLNIGCAQAAEFYFGKPVFQLSPAECALLAGLPQAPSRLNPLSKPARARKREVWVVQRMLEDGFLTPSEAQRTVAEPLRLQKTHRPFEAPHFVALLLASFQTAPCIPANRTSLDLDLNRFAESSIRRQLASLGSQKVGNAAAVVIDNRSGEVLALVGSGDYFEPRDGQVNGAWAPRSAGSTFKPFTYALALERGATPATVVADVPVEFATSTGLFAPVNYDHHCHGPMRYRLALANSLNIPAVKVLASIGGPAVLLERLRACGLSTLSEPPDHYGLGLTIGNAEARLLELANAYACLARLGEFKPYTLLRSADLWSAKRPDRIGTVSPSSGRQGPEAHRLFDSTACFLIADILSDNSARALEFGTDSSLRFDFPVACKTGTSSDFRDNWAFGYTPEFTIGVWAGNFDGSPMQGISGVTGAAPIMHEIMQYLHRHFGTSWYATPVNIVNLPVHALTGKRLQAIGQKSESTEVVWEKFAREHQPPDPLPHDYDSLGRVRLSPEYRQWLTTSDNWLGRIAIAESGSAALRIVFPPPGTTFYIDPDLPDSSRRIHLMAEGPTQVQWYSDTLPCQTSSGQSFARLTAGEHHLWARDPQSGRECETWVNVLQR